MKTKKEIECAIQELEIFLYTERLKLDLDQKPFFVSRCEDGIRYLKWVIE